MSDIATPNGTKSLKLSNTMAAQTATNRKAMAPPTADFDFSLGVTKAKVLKLLDDHVTPLFRKFYSSPLFDQLLQTCLHYLTSMFQLDWVVSAMERSRKQHLEGYDPYTIVQRIRELETEVAELKQELSPLYSLILLKYSSYEKPQQDRKFFECLYEAVIAIMDDAFERLKRQAEIEREISGLFRSKHFNIAQRKYQPPRSVDTLSVKELYALKNETANRALNAKMLSSLFEKPQNLPVIVASLTNSPLISQAVMSPIVARSMMKDPEQRAALFASPPPRTVSVHKEKRRNLGNVFRSAAMLQGVNPQKVAADITAGKLKMVNSVDIGVMAPDRARKADYHHRHAAAMLTPEMLGLPVDENYNYLTLIKRYVIHGPGLGLQPTQPPAGQTQGQLPATVSPTAGVPAVNSNVASPFGSQTNSSTPVTAKPF